MRSRRVPTLTYAERLRFAAVLAVIGFVMLLSSACACYQRPVTRVESRGSVYQISVTVHEDVGDVGWWGTGWVVARYGGRSYIMTAGHVCETRKAIENPDPLGLGTGDMAEVKSVDYELIAPDDKHYDGVAVVLDDDGNDLCVLSVKGDFGEPMPLATVDPQYGERGWYVGAPRAIWGGGIAGIYEATYSGRGVPLKGGCGVEDARLCDNVAEVFSTAEGAPGASGSPIFVGGRVVALLNMVDGRFPTFTVGVPWDTVRAFLARAHVSV